MWYALHCNGIMDLFVVVLVVVRAETPGLPVLS